MYKIITRKGNTLMAVESNTLVDLEQEFVDLGKFRPMFIVSGTGVGNHPHSKNGSDIALTAVNIARRARSQEGWSNVQIKRYSEVAGHYVLDQKTQAQAFDVQPKADEPVTD